jgi:hypothetical protein
MAPDSSDDELEAVRRDLAKRTNAMRGQTPPEHSAKDA